MASLAASAKALSAATTPPPATLLGHRGGDGCDLGPPARGDLADQSRPFDGQGDEHLSTVCLVLPAAQQARGDETVHHAQGSGGRGAHPFGELVEASVAVAPQDHQGAELGNRDRVLNTRQGTGGDPDQGA
jgi:hypothetical protein